MGVSHGGMAIESRALAEQSARIFSLSSFLSSVVLLTKEDGGEGWGEEAVSRAFFNSTAVVQRCPAS